MVAFNIPPGSGVLEAAGRSKSTVVLHGTWVPGKNPGAGGRFFVWGEMPVRARNQGNSHSRAATGKPPAHPYQAPEQELINSLRNLSAGLYKSIPLAAPGLERMELLLPTSGEWPLPAPAGRRLAGSNPAPRPGRTLKETSPTLTPWEVKGLAVSPVWVVNILSRIQHGEGETAQGYVLAADLRFWSLAAKLALELLVRERFIPAALAVEKVPLRKQNLVRAGTPARLSVQAAWRALLDQPEDARRVAILAAGMPPACRAPVEATPLDSVQMIEDFLHGTVDALARYWLALSPLEGRIRADADLPEKWTAALATARPVFSGPLVETRDLLQKVSSWTGTLTIQPDAVAFRTCFRLVPPAGDVNQDRTGAQEEAEPAWQLQFLLQASDDPSLLVPAGRVWQEGGSILKFLNRRFANPQERLLADLGRAARLFPPLERSLKNPSPEACLLTIGEAYTFLREAAGLLAESGFGVLLPPWWGQHRPRLGLRLRLKAREQARHTRKKASVTAAGLGFAALVDYEWEIALGDTVIKRQEFERLAAWKVPLVQARGQWVEVRPEELAAVTRFWQEQEDRGIMTLPEALRYGLWARGEAEETPGIIWGTGMASSLPLLGVTAEGLLAGHLERLQGNQPLTILPQPPGFQGVLRPYQLRGFSWLHFLTSYGLGACLADDMGLGKTIQLLALLLYRKKEGLATGPVLIICPTSVAGNWQREATRFAPSLKVLLHHGHERLNGDDFITTAAGCDLVISTYTLASRDERELTAVTWDGVVLDEAQNIKNPEAKQTRSIRRLRADFRIALTGTPVENNLGELWSLMEFLNPGYLGSQAGFRSRFMIPIERYGDGERAACLKRLVQPFILRRLKSDPAIIQDLPAKQEIKVYCHLTREQATLYEAVVQDMLQRIETAAGIERKGLVLATLAKLKQVCNHPAQFLGDGSTLFGRSGKLARLQEMLEEVLAAGEKALIFTQFAVMGQMLQECLQEVFNREVLFLHGGVPRSRREELIRRFQEEGEGLPFFILSLKAGGVGLNLTRANNVFHFDRWWNPAVEDQATDRAFRIGQQRSVQVYKFICAGTLEERIDALIESKRGLARQIVGTGEGWLTEMSTGELRELLSLRDQGVEL
ncbi:DEAD/DEAH box helicase [Moorella naiadis]|uniref:DEAD/DEAH box helicase n=1 Tax=Moorella naiadis (nom. illeg.) TaxID=3093670 RepID=UPI003D9C9B29